MGHWIWSRIEPKIERAAVRIGPIWEAKKAMKIAKMPYANTKIIESTVCFSAGMFVYGFHMIEKPNFKWKMVIENYSNQALIKSSMVHIDIALIPYTDFKNGR